MQYTIAPQAKIGQRISEMCLHSKLLDADNRYKVTDWASVKQGASGPQVWDVVASWLRDKKTFPEIKPNVPKVLGMDGNLGM